MTEKHDYDAVIIGAGIGGLVCGCYLAKSGLKTLIVEKNAQPGGCCTSFRRGGFTFDACVHSLGSLREGGILRTILQELGVDRRIEIKKYNPSDIILSPDIQLHFWSDINKTIQEIKGGFPEDSEDIEGFIDYINNCGVTSFGRLKSVTFQTLLDRYFKNDKLKAILSLPLLGNAGLPAKQISALTGMFIYKEFMLDGGYYPDGAMQLLPDMLAARFREFGGDIWYSHLVKKIKVENERVVGVQVEGRGDVSGLKIIANVDITQVVTKLFENESIIRGMQGTIRNMMPSLSAFVVYLGLDGMCDDIPVDTAIWHMPHYDIDAIYDAMIYSKPEDINWFMTRLSHDRKCLYMFVNMLFKNEEYWTTHKERLIDVFIHKINKVFPGVSSHIKYKDAATPGTLQKWTLNYQGAAYGWAWTPSQYAVAGLKQETNIENFYLTGHWTTLSQGVAGVAHLGRDLSQHILNRAG